jgi:acyl-CoA synthetase (AMP-forming)/AMP-acid ligase II
VLAPVSAAYNEVELATLLMKSKAKAIFTVVPLLAIARKAADLCNIPQKHVYVSDLPGESVMPLGTTTLAQLLERGQQLPALDSLKWTPGQSERQTAFLSHSSGTSGLPKLAAVSHRNIIANIIELNLFDQEGRGGPDAREVMLGILPSSHIYGVVVISHLSTYRGDSVIVLPRFDMVHMLECVVKHRINTLSIVPPIIVGMGKNPELLGKHDLSSVKTVLSGGAPLDKETLERLNIHYPHWIFRQGYGLTEIGAAVSLTNNRDAWAGSSGLVIPGITVKLLRDNGTEVTGYDEPGEVWAQSDGVIIGYVGDEMGTNETFVEKPDGRWLRTGDIALFRESPAGNEHIFIVDRIKEVIKVKVSNNCILNPDFAD